MIRLTIQRKVFLATFALATVMALVLTLVMRWNLGQGFARYTSAAEIARLDGVVSNVESEYAAHGSWDFVRSSPEQAWRHLSRPSPQGEVAGRPPPPWGDRPPDQNIPPPPSGMGMRQTGPPDFLQIATRLGLLDTEGKRLAGNPRSPQAGAERPIYHQGKIVGKLTLEAEPTAASDLDMAFLASQSQNMVFAGVAALLLSLVAAWLLARHLLAPIRDLSNGARQIANGSFDARIRLRTDDELGELGNSFNDMAERLGSIEESRRRWISETSHELRTPLAVLRAEIEAMQDGVRTPDCATFARLHKQVQQLAKLVDDLRLTLEREPGKADMEYEAISPVAVLKECIAAFGERFESAGIQIDTKCLDDGSCQVRGDAGRLTQVFDNLLENTLRYTHTGGRLSLASQEKKGVLLLQFDDTAPAPPTTAVPHLFERFYRAEPSRSRALGGSGLGLAICKTLIEAHGGRIGVALSKLGGLNVTIELPLEKS